MSVPLRELRRRVLDELDGEWQTASEIQAQLGLGHGRDWDRTCLVLERLANDGVAELQTPGAMVRRFRRAV